MNIEKIANKIVESNFVSADEMEEYCPVCASQIRAGEYQISRVEFEKELGYVAAVTDVKEEVPVEGEPSHTDETLKPSTEASMIDRIADYSRVALNKDTLVMISDQSNWSAYFVDKLNKARGTTDRSAMESALEAEDTITMGRVIVTPYRYFSNKDKNNFRMYGLDKVFEV